MFGPEGGASAKVWLDDLTIASWDDLTGPTGVASSQIVQENREKLQGAWDEFFGTE